MYLRTPRLAALLLLGPLALGSLAACGGGEPEAQPPPLSLTPSPTPTSAAPTVAPPGETARQFIYRFFALEKLAENTGDVEPFLAVTADCSSCREFARRVRAIYSAGGHVEYAGSTVVGIVRRRSEPGTFVYGVRVSAEPATIFASATAKPQRMYGGKDLFEMQLDRSGSAWRLIDSRRVVS